MVKIFGRDKHKKRLEQMKSENFAKIIAQGLYLGGQHIELEAELSITRDSVSGKNHVPSPPHFPPNADTRHLDGNIETVIAPNRGVNPRVNVESNAEYSAALEFGTSRMVERPFMRPAAVVKRQDVVDEVHKAVRRANRMAARGGGGGSGRDPVTGRFTKR